MPSHLKRHSRPAKKGLILIQIDGLSRFQFERALRAGRMPFTAKLLKKKAHSPYSFYPGQPSCTPAVQAELHYGVRCATPAFSFYDSDSRQEVRMYDAEWARRIAAESNEAGDGLLEGGSSYANIYRGGAKKSKYCGELNTLSHWMEELSLFRLGKLAFRNPATALRVCKLLAAEVAIGLSEAFRGITTRGDLGAELKFIPARLGVAIALREAIRSEVIDDIADDLPIIHANFFGYDEAAHRRGPHSRFAHWTLKGIDGAIRRIHRAMRKNQTRDYRFVVFSDHGQEHCTPYHEVAGRMLADATRDLFCQASEFHLPPSGSLGAVMERSKSLIQEIAKSVGEPDESKRALHLQALGPVAHLYADQGLSEEQKRSWATRYCREASVPIALYLNQAEKICCVTPDSEGGIELLSQMLHKRKHEFADTTIKDLEILIRSKYAGDIVLLGWQSQSKPITFADERGAHAGPGAEECRGFVLLPSDIVWPKSWMRPSELRQICLRELGRSDSDSEESASSHDTEDEPLRILTYNVHGGVGTDRKRDSARLAEMIRHSEADVLCFQEAFEHESDPSPSLRSSVSKAWPDSHHYTFLPLHRKKGVNYGLAIASRLPFRIRKSEAFKTDDARILGREPRGAIWIEVETKLENRIHIVNTHLGLKSWERALQTDFILSQNWLGSLPLDAKRIICGDLNASPGGAVYTKLATKLVDTQKVASRKRPAPSFYSLAPIRRIDHIFSSPSLRAIRSGVLNSALARRASDHLPVYADFIKA